MRAFMVALKIYCYGEENFADDHSVHASRKALYVALLRVLTL